MKKPEYFSKIEAAMFLQDGVKPCVVLAYLNNKAFQFRQKMHAADRMADTFVKTKHEKAVGRAAQRIIFRLHQAGLEATAYVDPRMPPVVVHLDGADYPLGEGLV